MFILQRPFISRVILTALMATLAAILALTAGTATAAPSRPAARTVKASPAVLESCGAGTHRNITKSKTVGAPPFTRVQLYLNVDVCFGGGLVWAPWDISSDGNYSIPCKGQHSNTILRPVDGVPRAYDADTSSCFLDGMGGDEKAPSILWVYDQGTQVDHTGIPAETYQMWFTVNGSGLVTGPFGNLYCIEHPVPEVCGEKGP